MDKKTLEDIRAIGKIFGRWDAEYRFWHEAPIWRRNLRAWRLERARRKALPVARIVR